MTPPDQPNDQPSALSRLERALAGFSGQQRETEVPEEPAVEEDPWNRAAAGTTTETPSSSVLDIASALEAIERLSPTAPPAEESLPPISIPTFRVDDDYESRVSQADARVFAAAAEPFVTVPEQGEDDDEEFEGEAEEFDDDVEDDFDDEIEAEYDDEDVAAAAPVVEVSPPRFEAADLRARLRDFEEEDLGEPEVAEDDSDLDDEFEEEDDFDDGRLEIEAEEEAEEEPLEVEASVEEPLEDDLDEFDDDFEEEDEDEDDFDDELPGDFEVPAEEEPVEESNRFESAYVGSGWGAAGRSFRAVTDEAEPEPDDDDLADFDDLEESREERVVDAAQTWARNAGDTPLPYFLVESEPPAESEPSRTIEELRATVTVPIPQEPEKKPSVVRTLAEIPILLIVAAVIAFLVKTFLAQAYYIPSGSMLPQLRIDDRVVVSKTAYKLHDPNRGDIVVFDDPRNGDAEKADNGLLHKIGEGIGLVQPSTDEFIKRVIGLPGETVEGRNGSVFINGRKLIEPYLPDGVTTSDFPRTTVKAGHLWVMGDNRPGSADSRVFGQIDQDTIVGRAVVTVWPFGHAEFL